MKKAAAVVLTLTVFLLQFPVLAETGRPLYAVRGENGLWGYIDPHGELVIPCRFTLAEDFRGGYAVACQYPEGYVLPEDPDGVLLREGGNYGLDGIIDTQGEWTVAPEWFGIMNYDEEGSWFGGLEDGVYLFEQLLPDGSKYGFFDIPSGYFSGAVYESVNIIPGQEIDPELICVTLDGKAGFVRRSTGEMIIPCRYTPADYIFSEDRCVVTLPGDGSQQLIIDRQGRETSVPDGLTVPENMSQVCEGLLAVRDNGTGLYGWLDADGRMAIAPQYAEANPFSEERACVKTADGQWAVIDRHGNEIFRRQETPYYFRYSHGLMAWKSPEAGRVVFVGRDGREVFSLTIPGLDWITPFEENGVAIYMVNTLNPDSGEKELSEGLLNDRGEILTPPVYFLLNEHWNNHFSEGLLPAMELISGKEGYLNEAGQWAFPPVDGACLNFRDGLAMIISYPDVCFVDREGNEIFRFRRYDVGSSDEGD